MEKAMTFGEIPSVGNIEKMSEFLKALSDPTRIRILFFLGDRECCVGEIADALGMSDSAVSHQLQLLRRVNLIRNRREGKSIYYALADDHVKTVLAQTIDHICEENG